MDASSPHCLDCGSHVRMPLPRVRVEWPWHLIQCHPGKHDLARKHLAHQNFQTFMPECLEYVTKRGQESEQKKPLFPGYLFVQIDVFRQPWFVIPNTVGVKLLFRKTTGQPLPMPARVMQLARSQSLQPEQDFADNAPARIRAGPFIDQVGFVRLGPDRRIHVMLNMLGHMVRLAVNRSDVMLLDKPS